MVKKNGLAIEVKVVIQSLLCDSFTKISKKGKLWKTYTDWCPLGPGVIELTEGKVLGLEILYNQPGSGGAYLSSQHLGSRGMLICVSLRPAWSTVVVWICLAHGKWHILGDVPLLEEVCHRVGELWGLLVLKLNLVHLVQKNQSPLACLWIKMCNSWFFQYHIYWTLPYLLPWW